LPELVRRIVSPLPAADPFAQKWLWALEDTRKRTLKTLREIRPQDLDAEIDGEDSIGTRLYHIGLIETDYLCIDVMGRADYLPELQPFFPLPDRDSEGKLSRMVGAALEEHLGRLAAVRGAVLEHFAALSTEEFVAQRELPDWGYAISPEWTLHHLMQHEAEHRGDISSTLARLRH
jgi:uncharacterized damage-inducible protein DinB